MIDLDFCDYMIIRQLCYDRREQVGLEECEKEGIGDLVRKVNAIIDGWKEDD